MQVMRKCWHETWQSVTMCKGLQMAAQLQQTQMDILGIGPTSGTDQQMMVKFREVDPFDLWVGSAFRPFLHVTGRFALLIEHIKLAYQVWPEAQADGPHQDSQNFKSQAGFLFARTRQACLLFELESFCRGHGHALSLPPLVMHRTCPVCAYQQEHAPQQLQGRFLSLTLKALGFSGRQQASRLQQGKRVRHACADLV